jgi:hypothetical protein
MAKKMSFHELSDEEEQAKKFSYPSAFDDYNVSENSKNFLAHMISGNRYSIWILHLVCCSFPSSSFICMAQ